MRNPRPGSRRYDKKRSAVELADRGARGHPQNKQVGNGKGELGDSQPFLGSGWMGRRDE